MTSSPETFLPPQILERGSNRGNEWAWPIGDIPAVIEAARLAQLVSIGGQLQFRFPDGGTCELYWIDVDTTQPDSNTLPWSAQVEQAAAAAITQFRVLEERYDFLAEGQREYGKYLDHYRSAGGDPRDAMCFVWYVESRP